MKVMKKITEKTKKLNLPSGKYVIVGGGALAAREIRHTEDIDLMVAEDLYEQLKKEGWEEREKKPGHFHLYKDTAEVAKNFDHIEGCVLNPAEVIARANMIDDVPVMALEDLVSLKRTMARDKDFRDIDLINKYLSNKA